MQTEQDIRRRRIQEAMARALTPPQPSFRTPPFVPQETPAEPQRGFRIPDMSGGQFAAMTPDEASERSSNAALGTRPDMPPAETLPVPEQKVPQIRVGYSTKGLSGLEKILERKKALEEASPMSSVKSGEDFVEIEPPKERKGFKGRLKSFGEGVLSSLAMADPDNPNAILGSMIGGGIASGVKREAGPQLKRKFEIRQAENDLARGLKLEQEQAQLGGMEALRRQRELEPAIQARKIEADIEIQEKKLEVERQRAEGVITRAEADRRQRELDRQSREKIAADRITSQEKIAGMRPGGVDTREAKRVAAQSEYDQLVADERAAGEEKNRAYAVVEKMRAEGQPKEDIAQAVNAAEAADKLYNSFGEKKRDAQRRITENTGGPSTTTQPYAGRVMTRASLERYAKDKGISLEEAQKQVEAQGVKVQ